MRPDIFDRPDPIGERSGSLDSSTGPLNAVRHFDLEAVPVACTVEIDLGQRRCRVGR